MDELFIAMGYVKSQNQTLLFDGPICQDQLANVSRDCMIACEECLVSDFVPIVPMDNERSNFFQPISDNASTVLCVE